MCYHLSLFHEMRQLEQRFGAGFDSPQQFAPAYHKAAFGSPAHPVITDSEPDRIRMFEWGLVPGWVRDEGKAGQIRKGTYNAKAETVFDKPSFRSPIMAKRCLVLADGFFEWHHSGGRKYPYYIRLKGGEPFAFAGIWDEWAHGDRTTGTFSIITTEANPMLARIHNTKKRMPVILRRDQERRWLERGLEREQIGAMLKPHDDNEMESHPVSGMVSSRGHRDGPELIAPFEYKELKETQRMLF